MREDDERPASMRRAGKMREVEERHGEPFWTLVRRLAAQGMSRRGVAEVIGYDWSRFCSLLRSDDAPDDLPWATPGREHDG